MLWAAVLALAIPEPRLRLMAVGDVMLGRYVRKKIERYGAAYPFAKVEQYLRQGDLVIGNLECALTARPACPNRRFSLIGDPSSVSALRRAGFHAVSLANNHSLDAGPGGLEDTIRALTRSGVAALSDDATRLVTKGLRVSLFGFTSFDNPILPFPLKDQESLRKIATERTQCDVMVVFVHWGTENTEQVRAEERKVSARLVAAGTDLVIGAHPHVLQPVERVRSAGRTGLVAYSLGNFVFDARAEKQRNGAVLDVEIGRQGVANWRLKPVRIVNHRPRLASTSGNSARNGGD